MRQPYSSQVVTPALASSHVVHKIAIWNSSDSACAGIIGDVFKGHYFGNRFWLREVYVLICISCLGDDGFKRTTYFLWGQTSEGVLSIMHVGFQDLQFHLKHCTKWS